MNTIKTKTKLHDDGTLTRRGTKELGDVFGIVSNPYWSVRLKAWGQLNKFGRFPESAAHLEMSPSDIDYAARYGNHDDKCNEVDWSAIQSAIDDLAGRTAKRDKLKARKQKNAVRMAVGRNRLKWSSILTEFQNANFVIFPTHTASIAD